MSKLRTLKDFKKIVSEWNHDYDCNYEELLKKLRNEAIKWVKELQKNEGSFKTNNGLEFKWEGKVQDISLTLIEWIKHFFNITNKELEQEDGEQMSKLKTLKDLYIFLTRTF